MIGIINYYKADNYGAVLQCYALQKAIEQIGEKSEIINYNCEYVFKHYKLLHMNSVKQLASDIAYLCDHYLKKKVFQKFRLKYLRVSKNIYDKNTICNSNKIYNIFITGSDQVFNYKCTDFDYNFFLEFVSKNNHKCAYGASYGFSDIPVCFEEEYIRLLSDFEYLSFREKTGVELTKRLIGRETINVLDPTLLVPSTVWAFEQVEKKSKKYILVYMLERSDTLLNFTKDLAQQTGLEVLYIGSLIKSHRNGLKAKYLGHESPENFVNLFKNAEYVVTNSFHGTAFSIIFHRLFFTEKLKYGSETNDRFTSLLNQLGLSDRILDTKGMRNAKDITIDYDDVEVRLEELRKQSVDYLKEICTLDNNRPC